MGMTVKGWNETFLGSGKSLYLQVVVQPHAFVKIHIVHTKLVNFTEFKVALNGVSFLR